MRFGGSLAMTANQLDRGTSAFNDVESPGSRTTGPSRNC